MNRIVEFQTVKMINLNKSLTELNSSYLFPSQWNSKRGGLNYRSSIQLISSLVIVFFLHIQLSAQHTITIREEGRPIINNIEVIHDNCINSASTIFIDAEGEHLEYILNGDIVSPVPFFNNLEVGYYFVEVRNMVLGCTSSNSQQVEIESLCEVCGDSEGLDEDRDGSVNCEDTDCQPIISDVVVQPVFCDNGQGSITITATGENLIYDLNGVANSNPVRTGLSVGTYTLSVFNSFTYCRVDYPVDIIITNTCEILGNGIDDDGDGDTDCDDSEHGVTIRVFYPANASCPDESGVVLYDAELYVEADGANLEFKLEGTFLDESGVTQSYEMLSPDGQFDMLYPGDYTLTVRNTVSICTDSRDFVILRECEICGNDIDDDNDGYLDCEDADCLLGLVITGAKDGSVQKSDDDCELPSEEDLLKLTEFQTSASVETEEYAPEIFNNLCGTNNYYIAPDGKLIDPSKIETVTFLSPTSPYYNQLKYIVTGFTLSNGEYYKAVLANFSILDFDLLTEFRGFFRYNRDAKKFDGNWFSRYELDDDIYINSGVSLEDRDATVVLHSGSSCHLEYKCIENWNFESIHINEVQEMIVEKILSDNSIPQKLDLCDENDLNDILVMVNGYRKGDDVPTYNTISNTDLDYFLSENVPIDIKEMYLNVFFNDPFGYWNTSNYFKSKLKPSVTVYSDGHHHINTSNHRNQLQFGRSLASIEAGPLYWFTSAFLNDTPNDPGFQKRRLAGYLAGYRLVEMIETEEIPVTYTNGLIDQKIDIVAHSMGYAHALGIIDRIKDSGLPIAFDRFYILAPENAGSKSAEFAIDDFEEVWQYGSKRGVEKDEDPIEQQDGVAAQIGVKNITETGREFGNRTSYGRAFIPPQNDLEWTKNFLNSHSEGNYRWIFTKIGSSTINGYIDAK